MEGVDNSSRPKGLSEIRNRLARVFHKGKESESVPPVPLKDFLLQVTKGEQFRPEEFPARFDLGEFGKEAEKLMKATIRDPKHREYLSKSVIDRFGKIFFISANEGDEYGVQSPRRVPYEEDLLIIHSHPHDTPFSPPDLDHLFDKPNRKGWTMPVDIVATPTQKVLLFRTSRTPETEGSQPKMDMMQEPAMGEEVFDMPHDDLEALNRLAPISNKRMYALTRVAQKYQLKIYSCPINKNVASLTH